MVNRIAWNRLALYNYSLFMPVTMKRESLSNMISQVRNSFHVVLLIVPVVLWCAWCVWCMTSLFVRTVFSGFSNAE